LTVNPADVVDVVLVIARYCLAAAFLYSAVQKTRYPQHAFHEIRRYHLPFPSIIYALTLLVQWGGSLCLMTGVAVWPAAMVLAIFTLASSCIAHGFWKAEATMRQEMTIAFLEHLGLVGGLLALAVIDFSK